MSVAVQDSCVQVVHTNIATESVVKHYASTERCCWLGLLMPDDHWTVGLAGAGAGGMFKSTMWGSSSRLSFTNDSS